MPLHFTQEFGCDREVCLIREYGSRSAIGTNRRVVSSKLLDFLGEIDREAVIAAADEAGLQVVPVRAGLKPRVFAQFVAADVDGLDKVAHSVSFLIGLVNVEPVLPRVDQVFSTKRQSRGTGKHGIDAATGAERRLTVITPTADFASGEYGQAVKTCAAATAFEQIAMVHAVDESRLHGVRALYLPEDGKQAESHGEFSPDFLSVG